MQHVYGKSSMLFINRRQSYTTTCKSIEYQGKRKRKNPSPSPAGCNSAPESCAEIGILHREHRSARGAAERERSVVRIENSFAFARRRPWILNEIEFTKRAILRNAPGWHWEISHKTSAAPSRGTKARAREHRRKIYRESRVALVMLSGERLN